MSEDWGLTVRSVTDGDTVRGHLTRDVGVIDGWALTVHSTDLRGVPLRLIILDTPERGYAGYFEARQDVINWCVERTGRLRCETYESGGFDRHLADVYTDGDRSDTLSQWMLRRGWASYLG